MKNLRNLLATVTLLAILMVGASTAQAGILMTDQLSADTTTQPCKDTTDEPKVNDGIIVHLTGIIVHFTGIIVHVGSTDTENTECGIIVHD